jgi:hypothetical protein
MEIPQQDIFWVYHCYFELFNSDLIKMVHDEMELWIIMRNFLIQKSNNEKLGDMCKKSIQMMDFSFEKTYKIKDSIIKNIIKEKLNPDYYSNICTTTKLFCILIKEVLEYMGVINGMKTMPERIYKNNIYILDILQFKLDKLKQIEFIFFQ